MAEVPYVQDTDQWVAYFMNMAEDKVLDRSKAYVTGSGKVLYPVETKTIRYQNRPDASQQKIKLEMVSPIEKASDINEADVAEEKKERKQEGLPPPPKVDIKVPLKSKQVIQSRAAKRASHAPTDQLSTKKRK